jgi:hypothetical protein
MQPEQAASVDPQETLFVTARKRFVPVYGPNEEGARELVLHVGTLEISFDEPDLFPWAETLIQQDNFLAGSAASWSAEPLEWPRVQGLLDSLIEAGILARTAPVGSVAQQAITSEKYLAFVEEERQRPDPPGPRSWSPDAAATLREILGRDLPSGYIETVVPVFRLAHIALDREGRQVGEVNSFPNQLRLKIPTEWKTCGYAGSRYRDAMPMNMTALRSMITHWKPVLRATLAFREEFLKRYPQLPDGRWKLGEVHFVSTGMLGLVSWQLMRTRDAVKTADLDPVLSSLFRVIDGVRLVAAHLLDLYERPMIHDTPVTPKEIAEAAEREDQYRSGRGVCAGPQLMIDELIETVMNGKPVEGAEGPEPVWFADIPVALDYSLRGVQLQSALASLWVRMGLAYERIHDALERHPSLTQGRLGAFRRQFLERDWPRVLPGRTHTEVQRAFSGPFYQRAFNNAQRGIRGLAEKDRKDLAAEYEVPATLLGERASGALRDLFASCEEPAFAAANAALLQEIAGYVLDYLRFERNALRTITAVQREINHLLGRPHPSEPLTGTHLSIAHDLRRGAAGKGMFYLLDSVRDALGIAFENQQDATAVLHQGRTLVLH